MKWFHRIFPVFVLTSVPLLANEFELPGPGETLTNDSLQCTPKAWLRLTVGISVPLRASPSVRFLLVCSSGRLPSRKHWQEIGWRRKPTGFSPPTYWSQGSLPQDLPG